MIRPTLSAGAGGGGGGGGGGSFCRKRSDTTAMTMTDGAHGDTDAEERIARHPLGLLLARRWYGHGTTLPGRAQHRNITYVGPICSP